MSYKRTKSETETTDLCPICHEEEKIHAIAPCNHHICFKCSTRLRHLHQQFYCPICRADCNKVIFVHNIVPYETINSSEYYFERKSKIFLEDDAIRNEFKYLIAHHCVVCLEEDCQQAFKDFKSLQTHIQRIHKLFFCKICVENVKLFSQERKVYSRQDLVTHKKIGDPDDKSFKGHPLCQICDNRFLDTDELWRHLRKDHYYCHFCDADGEHIYFGTYDDVKDHFRTDHYLCEEDQCADIQFTNAFRSEMDLKAHKAANHLKGVKRSQQRLTRTLDIDFNYGESKRNQREFKKRPGRDDTHDTQTVDESQTKPTGRGANKFTQEELDTAKALAASMQTSQNIPVVQSDVFVESAEDFPALNGDGPKPQSNNTSRTGVRKNWQQTAALDSQEEYPTLSKPSVQPANSSPKLSAKTRLNNGSALTSVKAKSNPWNSTEEEFPTLKGAKSRPHVHGWHLQKPEPKSSLTFVNNQRPAVNSREEFPSLGGNPSTNLASLGSWINQQRPVSNTEQVNNSNKGKVGATVQPAVQNNNKKKKKSAVNKSATNKLTPDDGKLCEKNSVNSNTDSTRTSLTSAINKDEPDKKSEKSPVSTTELSDQSTSSISTTSTRDSHANKKKSKNQRASKKLASLEVDLDNDFPVLSPSDNAGKSNDNNVTVTKSNGVSNEVSKRRDENQPQVNLSHIDYPSLSAMKPPPGLKPSNHSVEKAAPGLTKHSVPPGFPPAVQPNRTHAPPGLGQIGDSFSLNSLANMFDSSVDLTPDLPYTEPVNFSQRNKKLSFKLKELIYNNMDKFHKFRNLSLDFRSGTLTAKQFYESCDKLLGERVFTDILPELLALLPDIPKQQLLYSLCKDRLSANLANPKMWGNVNDLVLTRCDICKQIMLVIDVSHHEAAHGINVPDFPTLMTARQPKSAWSG